MAATITDPYENTPPASPGLAAALVTPNAPRPMIVQQQPKSGLAAALAGLFGNNSGAPRVPNDTLAQALLKNAMPTGPMYNPLEPIGRLAELWAGNRGEQNYLQQRQKAVADFGNSMLNGDPTTAINAGLSSPLPEVQQTALEMAHQNMYPVPMGSSSVSGLSFFRGRDGQMYSLDPGGHYALVDQGASGGQAGGQQPPAGPPPSPGAASVPAAPAAAGGNTTGTPNAPQSPAASSGGIPVNGMPIGAGPNPWVSRIMYPDGSTAYASKWGGVPTADPNNLGPSVQALRKELIDKSANFPVVRDAASAFYATIPPTGQPISGPAAAAAVTAFARAINPNAVLKPNQGLDPIISSAGLNGSFNDRMMTEFQNALTGQGSISPDTIGAMSNTVNNIYSAADKIQAGNEAATRTQAKQWGIPDAAMSDVIPDFRAGFKLPPAAASPIQLPADPVAAAAAYAQVPAGSQFIAPGETQVRTKTAPTQ